MCFENESFLVIRRQFGREGDFKPYVRPIIVSLNQTMQRFECIQFIPVSIFLRNIGNTRCETTRTSASVCVCVCACVHACVCTSGPASTFAQELTHRQAESTVSGNKAKRKKNVEHTNTCKCILSYVLICAHTYTVHNFGGARGVMVIIAGNRYGDTCSNPGRG